MLCLMHDLYSSQRCQEFLIELLNEEHGLACDMASDVSTALQSPLFYSSPKGSLPQDTGNIVVHIFHL